MVLPEHSAGFQGVKTVSYVLNPAWFATIILCAFKLRDNHHNEPSPINLVPDMMLAFALLK